MRVYIAGPVSGYDFEERKATFAKAAERLYTFGYEPINPIHDQDKHALTEDEWVDFLRSDIKRLVTCDAIYLLKGYAHSRGAQLELHIARELGLKEMYEDHPETILEEAERIVSGDRGPQYGHPAQNFTDTAKLWSAYLGYSFNPEDVAVMMILLKIAREKNRPKRDNRVDIAGYTKTLDMVVEARQRGEID